GRDPAVLPGRGEQPLSGHGGERDRDEELRVVADARAGRGGCPVVVEDELTLAVALHVQRTRADQPIAVPHRQVLRQPSRLGAHGAGFLEGGEPVPLEERRAVADQRVPGVARHLAQRTVGPYRRHRWPTTRTTASSRRSGRGATAPARDPRTATRRQRG